MHTHARPHCAKTTMALQKWETGLGRREAITFSSVSEQPTWPSKLHHIPNLQAIQVLRHLPSLRKFGVHTLHVDLIKQNGTYFIWNVTTSEPPADRSSLKRGQELRMCLFPNPCTFFICPKDTCLLLSNNSWKFTNPRKRRIRSSWGSFLPPYLDDEIHVASVLITGDRSVRPDDQAAIDPGRKVDMFAWGTRGELRKGCL